MYTKKEIKKRYNKLLEDVRTKDFYKINLTNRVNCYVCDCKHITKTRDIDAGVTPFLISCERCGGTARSTFYTDIAPEQQPTQEWYRPSLEQLLKIQENEAMLLHILKGGLDIRKINY
jgi:hypothetical protein